MNLQMLKGYVLVVTTGCLLLAGGLLIVLQWGNVADFTAYGPHVEANTALLIVISGAAGIASVLLVRLFVSGVRSLMRGRRERDNSQAGQRLADLEKARQDDSGDDQQD